MTDAEPETGNEDTPINEDEPTGTEKDKPARLPDDHPLVKTAEARKAEIHDLKAKLKEHEDAQLSETERKDQTLASEKKRGDDAEAELARLRVAMKHGLTEDDDLDLLGTGTPEELEARAKRIASLRGDKPDPKDKPVGALGGDGNGPTDPSTENVLKSIPSL